MPNCILILSSDRTLFGTLGKFVSALGGYVFGAIAPENRGDDDGD